MTRLIRVLSIGLAAVSLVAYGGASFYARSHTDRNGPKIEMEKNEIVVSIQDGQEKLLDGVKAIDRKDGDVTKSLVVESVGAFIERGKRPITVAAFDSDDNVSKAERIVTYQDYVSPRISILEPLRAPLNNVGAMTKGVHVADCLEGDISENVQITPVDENLNYNLPGEYAMKLIVTNNAGDVVELPVTVELYEYASDAAKPRVILSQYLAYTTVGQPLDPMAFLQGIEVHGSKYFWNGQTAAPPIDPSQIVLEGSADYNTPGVYEFVFRINDGTGNGGSVRFVVVVEK